MHDSQITPAGGVAGNQTVSKGAPSAGVGTLVPASSARMAQLPVLLTDKQAAEMWGIGLTLFHELRSSGADWFPRAVVLSPRVVRYVRGEVESAAHRMPRQTSKEEPSQLRRGRIERMKRAAGLDDGGGSA